MAAHVDKPRKEEAAGVLDHPMGKGADRWATAASRVWLKARMVLETSVNSFNDRDRAARFGKIAAVRCAEVEQAQPIRAGSAVGSR